MEPDDTTQQARLYPAWRQVQSELMTAGLRDEQVLTDAWLASAFGLGPRPESFDDGQRWQGLFNFQVGMLIEGLLKEQRILLQRVEAVGYVVMPPEEQTRHALKQGTGDLGKAMQRMTMRTKYIRFDQLSDAARRENADAQAKLAALAGLITKQLPGPSDQ